MRNCIALLVLGMVTASCAPKVVAPVTVKTYIDCCNPSLQWREKDMCRQAATDSDHILWDGRGNSFVFIWSECEAGKERWREWED